MRESSVASTGYPVDVRRLSSARHSPLQAPVDLRIREAVPLLLPDLEWVALNRVPAKLRIANTGHTVILSPRWSGDGPRLRGGPLKGEYVLSQVHFHWGQDDDTGSEHSVDGKRLALEMHAVSYKSDYDSHEKALAASDGTVVTAFFFLVQERDNPALAELTAALSGVSKVHSSCRHPAFALSRLVPPLRSDYLAYWGTVGAKDTSHRLLWLADRKPIAISRAQMRAFRRVEQQGCSAGGPGAAPLAPPGAVFHADPTRRPPSAPTLLPLSGAVSPSSSPTSSPKPSLKVTPKASPQPSLHPVCEIACLQSGRMSRSRMSSSTSAEKRDERRSSRHSTSDALKDMTLEQVEAPFEAPQASHVGFSFKFRRSVVDADEEPAPRSVSFNRVAQVQFPNRKVVVEPSRAVVTSSEGSESDSSRESFYTPRSSPRVRSGRGGGEKRRRGLSSSRTASSYSLTSPAARPPAGICLQHRPRDAAGWPAGRASFGGPSPSASVELACADLREAGRPPPLFAHTTRPSVINTCGIEDLLIETVLSALVDPHAATLSAADRTAKSEPELPAILPSSRSRHSGFPILSVLSRDHPNALPFMDKAAMGVAVAGSFVQEERLAWALER